LNLAQELGNVSKACKVMGLSRDTFYRYQAALEAGVLDYPQYFSEQAIEIAKQRLGR
jgi:ACT domain-containing protein